MKIQITSTLNQEQISKIEELQKLCREADSVKTRPLLSNELNYDPAFPCFYLGYEDGRLCAFLNIFRPLREEGEVFALTHPDARRQGCFSTLLQAAVENLRQTGASSLLFLTEPDVKTAVCVLPRFPVVWDRSEYRMIYPIAGDTPLPDGIRWTQAAHEDEALCVRMQNEIFSEEGDSTVFVRNALSAPDRMFCLVQEGENLVGVFSLHFETADTVFLYGLGLLPGARGRGLGAKLLSCACNAASDRGAASLVLDVDSGNPPALALYRRFGFQTTFQADYHRMAL